MSSSYCYENYCNCNKNDKFQKVDRKLQGLPGPQGPPGPGNTSYAVYAVTDNIDSGNDVPMIKAFDVGNLTSLIDSTHIKLTGGYIYFISYILSAHVGNNSYFQILPYINDNPYILYDTTGTANTASNGNATASGGFITNTASTSDSLVSFRLDSLTPTGIDVSGSISIFPIATIQS